MTAAAVVASRFAGRIPRDALRKVFGWFVVVMGVFVLSQQLPPPLGQPPDLDRRRIRRDSGRGRGTVQKRWHEPPPKRRWKTPES
ncbi:hypothetical protein ACFC00_42440 [Streptomyces adustus]|uniref:hypothetical protein n=1 Tax=Streptomyces adustus TaxID=1609272 RepID=UPI0035DB78B7